MVVIGRLFEGNYDTGWGDNDFLGGPALNLDASNYDRIVVSFTQAPWIYGTVTVRFNKAGDPDYCSASVPFHGKPGGNGDYTFLFRVSQGWTPPISTASPLGFPTVFPTPRSGSVTSQSAVSPDSDGDGVANGSDNCPLMQTPTRQTPTATGSAMFQHLPERPQ